MTHAPNLDTPFVSVLSMAAFETVELSGDRLLACKA